MGDARGDPEGSCDTPAGGPPCPTPPLPRLTPSSGNIQPSKARSEPEKGGSGKTLPGNCSSGSSGASGSIAWVKGRAGATGDPPAPGRVWRPLLPVRGSVASQSPSLASRFAAASARCRGSHQDLRYPGQTQPSPTPGRFTSLERPGSPPPAWPGAPPPLPGTGTAEGPGRAGLRLPGDHVREAPGGSSEGLLGRTGTPGLVPGTGALSVTGNRDPRKGLRGRFRPGNGVPGPIPSWQRGTGTVPGGWCPLGNGKQGPRGQFPPGNGEQGHRGRSRGLVPSR